MTSEILKLTLAFLSSRFPKCQRKNLNILVQYGRVFRNKTFYAFKLARLSESITSEILELWGSFFFQSVPNLVYIPKMQKKWETFFSFSDKCLLNSYVAKSDFF